VQNRKYLIYFGSQKTRTEFHNGSFVSVSSVPVLGYFGSVPRFRFFLPRPTARARLLLVICSRGVAVAARGLRGRQAHRHGHGTALHSNTTSRPPGPCAMHPRRPKFPCRSFPLQLCFPVPSSRSSSPPLHLGLNYSGRRLRLAMSPVCLRRSAAGMVVVSTVDRSTTTILRSAVEW
jgi:hypothetical protein